MSDEIVVLKKYLTVHHSFTDQNLEEMLKKQSDKNQRYKKHKLLFKGVLIESWIH
jgi:hypothetical protein